MSAFRGIDCKVTKKLSICQHLRRTNYDLSANRAEKVNNRKNNVVEAAPNRARMKDATNERRS
jgi:hypothetical protein